MKIGNDDVKKVYLGESEVSKVYFGDYDEAVRSEILKAMVCWYDPHRQGCSNANMAANPVLTDYSGNRRNMTCYNFDWTTTSGIAADGSLRFKRGAYGYVQKPVLTDFTIICRRKYLDIYMNQILASTMNEVPLEDGGINRGAFQMEYDQYNHIFGRQIFRGNCYFWDTDYKTVYMTKTSYNGEMNLTAGSLTDTNDLYLGSTNPILSTTTKGLNGCISCFMLFNRTLTDDEINWVKANLIENRYRYLVEVPGIADPNMDMD